MKNMSLALNGILLVAVIILYVLFFKQKNTMPANGGKMPVASMPVAPNGGIRIAYFNMDSLENQYSYVADNRSQLKLQEQSIGNELNNLKKTYMTRVQALQQKAQGQSMSQQESDAAQTEINQMQASYQQKEASLTQELQDKQFKMLQDINKKVEDFLKTYNQEKGYTFIFSHQPGDFIYYKDSAYNITGEIVDGLNAGYKKNK